jgi:hypothetical protein
MAVEVVTKIKVLPLLGIDPQSYGSQFFFTAVACRPGAGQRPQNKQIYSSFANKHVSTATIGYNNNGTVFCAVRAEML